MIEYFTSELIPKDMHGFLTKNFFINKQNKGKLNFTKLWEKSSLEKRILLKHLSIKKTFNFNNLHFLNQVHSSNVIEIKNLDFKEKVSADAMVTKTPGVVLCILTAECAPILFYEKKNNVIAIAHVGWKGAIDGIIKKTIDKMIKVGAEKRKIIAVVGPCISKKNYSVKNDFFKIFTNKSSKNKVFFKKLKENNYLFDFPFFIKTLLHEENIKNINFLNICTFEEKEKFYSYRKHTIDKKNINGRFLSYIRLHD